VHDVDAVDGLLLVLSPWAVRNLRFDEDRFTGFHGYDADICFQARAAGKRVVVDEIAVVHHTKGGYGDLDAYRRCDQAFRAKWGLDTAALA
jgi:GT2 family glycosyltransferase